MRREGLRGHKASVPMGLGFRGLSKIFHVIFKIEIGIEIDFFLNSFISLMNAQNQFLSRSHMPKQHILLQGGRSKIVQHHSYGANRN